MVVGCGGGGVVRGVEVTMEGREEEVTVEGREEEVAVVVEGTEVEE